MNDLIDRTLIEHFYNNSYSHLPNRTFNLVGFLFEKSFLIFLKENK